MEHAVANGSMKWLVSLALTFVVVACGQRMTVDSVRSDLAANIPISSRPAVVANYLNQKKLSSDGPVSVRELEYVDGKKDAYILRSILRNVRRSTFVTTDIMMTFTFDRNERLQSIDVKEVHTGL